MQWNKKYLHKKYRFFEGENNWEYHGVVDEQVFFKREGFKVLSGQQNFQKTYIGVDKFRVKFLRQSIQWASEDSLTKHWPRIVVWSKFTRIDGYWVVLGKLLDEIQALTGWVDLRQNKFTLSQKRGARGHISPVK